MVLLEITSKEIVMDASLKFAAMRAQDMMIDKTFESSEEERVELVLYRRFYEFDHKIECFQTNESWPEYYFTINDKAYHDKYDFMFDTDYPDQTIHKWLYRDGYTFLYHRPNKADIRKYIKKYVDPTFEPNHYWKFPRRRK